MIEKLLAQLRDAVSAHLSTTMEKYRSSFAHVGPEVSDLFDVAEPLLDRGKRLRAGFLAAGWRLFGGQELHEAEVRAGAGLELFQLAALIHDDLMDSSPKRRGLPAAHHQFASIHKDRGMTANRQTFGNAGALLLGDFLLVAAESELQAALDAAPEHAVAARAVFEEMMAEVTFGQYLDIYAQSAPWSPDPQVDVERAQRVIRSKSARYSVEHPLVLGAVMAGAPQEGITAVREIGLPVGEAFQLRDDVLGVFGDPSVTGKPAGDDLREGKRTLLVTLAMTSASRDEVDYLQANLGNADLTDADVERIRHILTTSGAVDHVEAIIAQRSEVAIEAITRLDADSQNTQILLRLAESAISRSH